MIRLSQLPRIAVTRPRFFADSVCLRRAIGFRRRFDRARQPQGSPEPARSRGWAGLFEPGTVHPERLLGIDEDIPVAISRTRLFQAHLLVPAMLTADGISVDGKGEVLMDSGIFPHRAGSPP